MGFTEHHWSHYLPFATSWVELPPVKLSVSIGYLLSQGTSSPSSLLSDSFALEHMCPLSRTLSRNISGILCLASDALCDDMRFQIFCGCDYRHARIVPRSILVDKQSFGLSWHCFYSKSRFASQISSPAHGHHNMGLKWLSKLILWHSFCVPGSYPGSFSGPGHILTWLYRLLMPRRSVKFSKFTALLLRHFIMLVQHMCLASSRMVRLSAGVISSISDRLLGVMKFR